MRGWFARKFRKRPHASFERFNLVYDNLNGSIHEATVGFSLPRSDLFYGEANRRQRILQFMSHLAAHHLPARNLRQVHQTFAALPKLSSHVVESANGATGFIIAL